MSHLMGKMDFCHIILPGDLMVDLEQIDTTKGVLVHKHSLLYFYRCLSEFNDVVKALEERQKNSLLTSQHTHQLNKEPSHLPAECSFQRCPCLDTGY